ncbi:MAG: hypothetical protein HY817_00525 [Candidatus Abawacabacteria bacterium]|nr:hypothetical protein [Candidatus Abawacabacteria bacterium]
MKKAPLLVICLFTLILTACGGSVTANYELTYRPIPKPGMTNNDIETIKTHLESRLKLLAIDGSEVKVNNNDLVVALDTDNFDISKAISLATSYDLTLQEPRQTLTAAEKEEVANYNQGQKNIINEAYKKVTEKKLSMDEVVMSFSEKVNHLEKGMRGPWLQARVKENAYWSALQKTGIGEMTPIVELDTTIWFAKVLEKIGNGETEQIRYQEVLRYLKRPEPRLNFAPITSLAKFITKAEVIKKDPNSDRNKNYAVKITLDEKGKAELARISEQYRNKELKIFVDDFPHASITFTTRVDDGTFLIFDDFNQEEATKIASQLSMPFMPASLSLISFIKH